jgi:hypothetical protein
MIGTSFLFQKLRGGKKKEGIGENEKKSERKRGENKKKKCVLVKREKKK